MSLTISFEGAARTVTGSRHRLRFGKHSWLFDCGLYQGHRDEAERVNRTFRFDPTVLDTVVLSHAHLDHSGNLPTLVAQGFRGRIHCTTPTADLCRVMLRDSAHLMERDVDHVNRHARDPGRGRRPARRPLYTLEDVERTLERLVVHSYHEPWQLFDQVEVTYWDAGHILGSALTTFEFTQPEGRFRLGMGGDLGRPGRPLLRDPEVHPGVDAQVLESTYGDRFHTPGPETEEGLAQAIRHTVKRGGRVLVPSFAIGRAQELVATLHSLTAAGRVPELPIFVDSPMAVQATEAFLRHTETHDEETRAQLERGDGAPLESRKVRYVASADESRALNDRRDPLVIIAASGMCEGGRILHHLLHGLGDARNTVLFVGYQAEGTLGRRIRDGAETVSIFGEPVRRRAEVLALDGFSAHADQGELLAWTRRLAPAPRSIFLVHGELESAAVLRERLIDTVSAQVHIPTLGEEFELWS